LFADGLAYSDDAADRLDGNHQRTIGEGNAAGGGRRKEGKEFVLFGERPTTITGTEPVGVFPS
jgi:hypothetical protein